MVWQLALLASIVALPVLFYLPFLNEPFERDEGVYSIVARGLLEGQLPYRDLFDHKPPLIYLWYALSFLLFGDSIEAPRLLASMTLSATTMLVYVEGRLLGSRAAGLVAAALFAASTGMPLLQANANTEVFMLLPMLASLVLCTLALRRSPEEHRQRYALLIAAGALGGIAVVTKTVAIWNLGALAVPVAIEGWRRRRWAASLDVAAMFLGSLATLVVVATPWLASRSLGDFFYANVTFNSLYATNLTFEESLNRLVVLGGAVAWNLSPLILVAALGFASLFGRARPTTSRVLLLTWGSFSLVGIATTGRFYPHYFVQLTPTLALLVIPLVMRIEAGSWGGRSLFGLTTLVAVAAASPAANQIAPYLEPTPELRHEAKFPTSAGRAETLSPLLAADLEARTTPAERIFIFGHDAQVLFYAHRQPAARFFYHVPYWLDKDTLAETMAGLEAVPPAFIVDTALVDGAVPQLGVTEEIAGHYYPERLGALIRARYRYVGIVEYAPVFELVDRAGPER